MSFAVLLLSFETDVFANASHQGVSPSQHRPQAVYLDQERQLGAFQSRPAMCSRLSTKPRLWLAQGQTEQAFDAQTELNGSVRKDVLASVRADQLAGAYHRMSLSSQMSAPPGLERGDVLAQLVVL